jgi:hypothetical protein
MELIAIAIVVMAGYVAYLKMQIHAQQREFAEFKKNVMIVPLPRKKQSPWIAVLAVSTLLLAFAFLLLALR